jgi:hypothetical protein
LTHYYRVEVPARLELVLASDRAWPDFKLETMARQRVAERHGEFRIEGEDGACHVDECDLKRVVVVDRWNDKEDEE